MKLDVARATFDGAILKRGFWLYLVEIVTSTGRHLVYVGRTGDTSSRYAASLFTRMTGHLNDRKSAKANSLLKRIVEQELACHDCSYRFVGIGPVFEQQATMEAHKPLRDQMAGLERAVADHLREKGYAVLADHPRARMVEAELLATALNLVDQEFSGPPNKMHRRPPKDTAGTGGEAARRRRDPAPAMRGGRGGGIGPVRFRRGQLATPGATPATKRPKPAVT